MSDWVKNIYLNPKKNKGSYLYDDNSKRSILDLYCFSPLYLWDITTPFFQSNNVEPMALTKKEADHALEIINKVNKKFF